MSGAVRGGLRAALSAVRSGGSYFLAASTAGRLAGSAVVGVGTGPVGAFQARAIAGISRGATARGIGGVLPLAAAVAGRSSAGVTVTDCGIVTGHTALSTTLALQSLARSRGL